jgi:TolB protein
MRLQSWSWRRALPLALACLLAGCGGGHGKAPAPAPAAPAPAPAALAPVAPPAGRLVFSLRDADGVHLWVADSDGRHRRQLTRQPGVDFDPHWSPDGRRVLFRTNRGRYAPDTIRLGTEGIFVINADGSGERQLYPPAATKPGGLFPDWAPDGRRVALSTARGGDETIVVVDLHGRLLRDLHAAGECAAWSPDGRHILYCSHGPTTGTKLGPWNTWVMRADGSGQTQVSRGEEDTSPGGWSPDGSLVAFGNGPAGVRVARPDGGGTRRVPLPVPGSAAGWWPDGRILFSWEEGGEPPTHWGLVRPDGTGAGSLPVLYGAGEVDFYPA